MDAIRCNAAAAVATAAMPNKTTYLSLDIGGEIVIAEDKDVG